MQYQKIVPGRFLSRPNRFIAQVEVEGSPLTVHVKNTGRCRELLTPGCRVYLAPGENPARKTPYDLVAVEKPGLGVVNMDSQAPNRVVEEWLRGQGFDRVVPEYVFGDSRLDFSLFRGEEQILMEVKGCTLEVDGVGYFPDAPTLRGTKHLRELTRAVSAGYTCYLAFVIQMPGIGEVRPNTVTDPAFAAAYREALAAGVRGLYLTCQVTPDTLTVTSPPLFP